MRSLVPRLLLCLLALVVATAPPLLAQSRAITVAPDSVTLFPGDTARLVPTVRAGGGAALSTASVTWSSLDTSLVAVRAGKLTAKQRLGCTTIRAQHTTYVRAEVAACVVAAPVVPPPVPAPTTVFNSDWSTATGSSLAAVTDGGQWSFAACERTVAQVMAVVPAAPLGLLEASHALQLRQLGGAACGVVQKQDAVPASTTHWGRFYVRNDESGSRNDHTMAYNNVHGGMGMQAVPFARYALGQAPEQWRAALIVREPYPRNRWYSPPLSNGTWYRYEYQVEFVTDTTIRIWPRIYATDGALLYDADDFWTEQGGRDVSLAAWYATGRATPLGVLNTETPRPEYARHFGLGNEGNATAAATGGVWYYAKLGLSLTGWLGR